MPSAMPFSDFSPFVVDFFDFFEGGLTKREMHQIWWGWGECGFYLSDMEESRTRYG
jgi:hypothetical protein